MNVDDVIIDVEQKGLLHIFEIIFQFLLLLQNLKLNLLIIPLNDGFERGIFSQVENESVIFSVFDGDFIYFDQFIL